MRADAIAQQGYMNTEKVVYVSGTPVWLNTNCDAEFLRTTKSHPFVTLSDNCQGTLSSPLECGRVLHLQDTLQDKIIAVKGVGATNFARRYAATNPLMFGEPPDIEEFKTGLKSISFLGNVGLMELEKGLSEIDNYQLLSKWHGNLATLLGLFILDELPDNNGTMFDINTYKQAKVIYRHSCPAVLYRQQKSQWRLSDIFMSYTTGHTSITERIFDEAVNILSPHVTTPFEWYSWLIKTMLPFELTAIFRGFNRGMFRWLQHARNITIMAEELDLEGMSPNTAALRERYTLVTHCANNFNVITEILLVVLDIMTRLTGGGRSQTEAATSLIIETTESFIGDEQLYQRANAALPNEQKWGSQSLFIDEMRFSLLYQFLYSPKDSSIREHFYYSGRKAIEQRSKHS